MIMRVLLLVTLSALPLATPAQARQVALGDGARVEVGEEWRFFKSTQLFKTELWMFEHARYSELRAFIESRSTAQSTRVAVASATRRICTELTDAYKGVSSMSVDVAFHGGAGRSSCEVTFRALESVTRQSIVLTRSKGVYASHVATIVYPATIDRRAKTEASRFLASLRGGER